MKQTEFRGFSEPAGCDRPALTPPRLCCWLSQAQSSEATSGGHIATKHRAGLACDPPACPRGPVGQTAHRPWAGPQQCPGVLIPPRAPAPLGPWRAPCCYNRAHQGRLPARGREREEVTWWLCQSDTLLGGWSFSTDGQGNAFQELEPPHGTGEGRETGLHHPPCRLRMAPGTALAQRFPGRYGCSAQTCSACVPVMVPRLPAQPRRM